MKLRLKKIMRS